MVIPLAPPSGTKMRNHPIDMFLYALYGVLGRIQVLWHPSSPSFLLLGHQLQDQPLMPGRHPTHSPFLPLRPPLPPSLSLPRPLLRPHPLPRPLPRPLVLILVLYHPFAHILQILLEKAKYHLRPLPPP